jgi:hypothetical protein
VILVAGGSDITSVLFLLIDFGEGKFGRPVLREGNPAVLKSERALVICTCCFL